MSIVRLTPRARVGYEVDASTGCWNWTGSCRTGYGKAWNQRARRVESAHRVVWERERGPVADGLDLDHLCRNRRCVNPAHLEPVTRFVNLTRGAGAKLTWSTVREIRRRYAAGGCTHRSLAAEYGISNRQVCEVVRNRCWREDA